MMVVKNPLQLYAVLTHGRASSTTTRGQTVQLQAIGDELHFALDDGGTVSVQGYSMIDGLAGELADGATFTTHDGCAVTRRGAEAIWTTPGWR